MKISAIFPLSLLPRSAPDPPWAQRLVCTDMLLAHWKLPPSRFDGLLPAGLQLDVLDGQAWLSVLAFMRETAGDALAPHAHELAGAHAAAASVDVACPEIVVQTYVIREGKPGIWIFSLDTVPRLPIAAGRARLQVPYVHAQMRCYRTGARVRFDHVRDDPYMERAAFAATYRAVRKPGAGDDAGSAVPLGGLDAWLTVRPRFYSVNNRGRLASGRLEFAAPQLLPATADIEANTLLESHGFRAIDDAGAPVEPLLHFVDRMDVVRHRSDPC